MVDDGRGVALRVLDSWVAFEVLSAQVLPRVGERLPMRRCVVGVDSPANLPWEDPEYARSAEESKVYWIVYFARIDLERAFDSIARLFPERREQESVPAKGEAATAAVVIDECGRPINGTLFLASFGWSYGRLRQGKIKDLPHFEEEKERVLKDLSQIVYRHDHEQCSLPLNEERLHEITSWLIEKLNLPETEADTRPLYIRCPYSKSKETAPEVDLLNSFFLNDLTLVRSQVAQGNVGVALSRYLNLTSRTERRDVLRNAHILNEIVSPARLPLSRWPSPGGHSLFLMQQAAVNHAADVLTKPGIVAVNGPPGTGKTTLLRDIISHVVLTRAEALAAFADPNEAFEQGAEMKTGPGYTKAYKLDPSLIGHEIVIASSNNKAVENITKELPARGAVADGGESPLRYFSSISDRLVESSATQCKEGQSWGLCAAVLGNSKNTTAFFETFWWDKEYGIASYLSAAVGEPVYLREPGTDERRLPRVVSAENPPKSAGEAQRRWQFARESFRQAYDQVRSLQSTVERLKQAVDSIAHLRERASQRERDAQNYFKESEIAEEDVSHFEQLVLEKGVELQECEGELQSWLSLRPGFFARLFHTRAYRDWATSTRERHKQLATVRTEYRAASKELAALERGLDQIRERCQAALNDHRTCVQDIEAARALIKARSGEVGANLADEQFWLQDPAVRELCSPWTWPAFERAREELFAASFALHRAFIDCAARKVRANLRLAIELFKDGVLPPEIAPYRTSIFATFFLVVPTVSTTFASFGRLFAQIKREEIGWLMVDEAGQATPQQAAGALYRSQRAVIIGDPLQIEPVVPLPSTLVQAVCDSYGVSADHWAAPFVSVQSRADEASEYGTVLHSSDGSRVIGMPLRVHRRCEEPMFSISNQIAYGGLMVYGTPAASSEIGHVLGCSSWFDVHGESQGKWIVQEGEMVVRLIERLLSASGRSARLVDLDIFIISPFRQVAAEMREALWRSGLAKRLQNGWSKERIGTVHTFQGKEAEAVIFLLGAAGDRCRGARRWVAQSPNIVNVAVTRAKRRLYVVGCYESWRSMGCMKEVAAALPHEPALSLAV